MTEVQELPRRGRGRPPGTGRPKTLSPKQSAFVASYLRSGNAAQAADETGFGRSYCRKLVKVPAVATAIAEARKAVQIKAEYNLETAMDEAADAMAFARKTENATALIRGVEIRAKLQGLMIDRVDQRQVGAFQLVFADLNGAPKTVDAAAAGAAARTITAADVKLPSYDEVFD